MFTLHSASTLGRRGTLTTAHGAIETPFFLPVATGGAMRGISLDDLESLGAQALLCNTYHLHIAPGERTIDDAGGLHPFIGWNKPILTDSGGFQVFSLQTMRRIEDNGVRFHSYRDGSLHFLGPREVIGIQHALGSDIIMCLDECPPSTAPRRQQVKAVDRTLRWAKECREWHGRLAVKAGNAEHSVQSSHSSQLSHASFPSPLLFAIIQGGLEADLRRKCAQELIAIGFDGYAIGGLAVGESPEEMHQILSIVCQLLPEEKPRYLMGVGKLGQMEKAIAQGIDMFDCVLPMREARHGTIYLSDGSALRIKKAGYAHDHSPLDRSSLSPLSHRHSRSYLSHLFRTGERSAVHIACMQNMAVTLAFMKKMRSNIDCFAKSAMQGSTL